MAGLGGPLFNVCHVERNNEANTNGVTSITQARASSTAVKLWGSSRHSANPLGDFFQIGSACETTMLRIYGRLNEQIQTKGSLCRVILT